MAVPEICEWKSEHARPLERKRAAVTQPFTTAITIFGFGSLSFFPPLFFFLSRIIYRINFFLDQRRIVVYI